MVEALGHGGRSTRAPPVNAQLTDGRRLCHSLLVTRPYEAWLLDLDGTLYRSGPVKLAMAAELALRGPAAVRTLHRFRREHEWMREHQSEPCESPYRLQLQRTAEAIGADPAGVERLVSEWMHLRPGKWLRRFRRNRLIAELHEFRGGGGRAALISDYPARAKLRALECSQLFDAIVANGEPSGPRFLKPHPEGYLRAAEALGVSPKRCLVVGDRQEADGEAARRAGMDFRRIK